MNLNEKDKFGLENRSGNPPNHHPPGISAEWQPDKSSMRLVSSNTSIANSQGNMGSSPCPSVSMVDSFPSIWNYSTTSPNLGFCQNELQTSTSTYTNVPIGKPFPSFSTFDMDWNSLEPTIPVGPGILHPNLLPFPTDPAFMELDSRLSCFKGGTSGGIVHPFVTLGSLNPSNASRGVVESRIQKSGLKMPQTFKDISLSVDHGSKNGSTVMNRRDTGCLHVGVSNKEGRESGYNEGDQNGSPGSANASGDSSSKAVGDKKRKRSNQGIESNQQEGSQKLATETTKENTDAKLKLEPHGNQVKDSPETPKEDYIHVRARHGQATNSHSLAERVRREKISERMKYLQELVPGCNKVTGKAVMLDEIINYVQSLQRQVEFLSMKLATVNPHLDFDIEGFLAKEVQSRVVPSSSIGFSPDMMLAQFHPSQQGLIQAGISGNVNPSDVLRRAVHAQLASMNAFKEHMPQAHNAWDSELQNIAQSTFMATPPINPQELNGKPWLSFP